MITVKTAVLVSFMSLASTDGQINVKIAQELEMLGMSHSECLEHREQIGAEFENAFRQSDFVIIDSEHVCVPEEERY